jgi:hypothetical protein
MAQQRHIFLSYRSLEVDFALKLAADLKNAGFGLWMDRLDGIQGGDDWRWSIERALMRETCDALVAVVSPDYVTSAYCRNELARASRLGIPIIPILLSPVPETDWPLEIERTHYIDFCHWREASKYPDCLDELLSTFRVEYPAQVSQPPDAETQYLNNLIADLEGRRGVKEYVELTVEASQVFDTRPRPMETDE